MSQNPTAILASFSVMKSLVDAERYQNPYQILAEFVRYIIAKNHIHTFTAVEMKCYLFDLFGFNVPEAVVRTAVKKLDFIRTKDRTFYVDSTEAEKNSFFEKTMKIAEKSNDKVIELLESFIRESDSTINIVRKSLTQEFIAILLDDWQTTSMGKYTDLINKFILKYENDHQIQDSLEAVREGSILYIGLNYNIDSTGSIENDLIVLLDTEVLFSLYGYNGEVHKQLAQDFYRQIEAANKGKKRIRLRYFLEVKKEIDDFFLSAENIVEGKISLHDTVAMRNIINGCSSVGDVKVRQADFYSILKRNYGIIQDEKTDYYGESDKQYNLEDLSFNTSIHPSIRAISHINKLRKGMRSSNILDSRFIFITNTAATLKASAEQVEQEKRENHDERVCEYAISVDRFTNILWYKLGNGFGGKEYPTNVNAVLKARILLASKIKNDVSKLYSTSREEYKKGIIDDEQLTARIIALRRKPITPEELSLETIDEDLDFSTEYFARYEEEVKRNKNLISELNERHERDAERASEAQSKIDYLEKIVAEYQKEKEESRRKKSSRKKKVRIALTILIIIGISLLLIWLVAIVIGKIDNIYFNAIGLIGALASIIPGLIGLIKRVLNDNQN